MEPTTTPDYPRGVTFEQVWATLQDLGKRQKEIAEEHERWTKKNVEERERWMKENAEEEKRRKIESDRSMDELKRIVRRNSKQMGDLHRKFGKLAEHLVLPNIHKRFNELGYRFTETCAGGLKVFNDDGSVRTEIDKFLQNEYTLMALEVKLQPAVKDVAHHIKRLEILRDHKRKLKDNRKIQGGISGAIFGVEEKKATIDAGLFVIEQTGDTMKIDVPEGFVPREW